MRKILLAAAGFAALAGVAGFALAQDQGAPQRQHGVFQSDANSDGVLTRQEFDTGRDANFTRLDANNDGQLTREERRAERGDRRGRRGGRHGGMHSLERADANNDGNVTRDEFLARPTQMFDRLDANDDGVISTAERPQRRERADGEQRQRPERVNPDANGDNQISRSEFAAMSSGMFERLDANSDGRVTREEAEAARPHRRGR
jgi:hypothetical protein